MMSDSQRNGSGRTLRTRRNYPVGRLTALLAMAGLLISLAIPTGGPLGIILMPAAWAGPVNWQEVPATEKGRQWWDAGSLRRDRRGTLSVLSRFQPSAPDPHPGEPQERGSRSDAEGPAQAVRQPLGTLVVMELDCDLTLYRDVAVNGLPRFNASWQPTGGDPLVAATLQQACEAARAAGLVARVQAG